MKYFQDFLRIFFRIFFCFFLKIVKELSTFFDRKRVEIKFTFVTNYKRTTVNNVSYLLMLIYLENISVDSCCLMTKLTQLLVALLLVAADLLFGIFQSVPLSDRSPRGCQHI